MRKKFRVVDSVSRSASTYTMSLGCTISSASTKVLTKITAVLAPQPHLISNDIVSSCDFSSALGLNSNTRYRVAGLKNRDNYNKVLDLLEDIEIKESVTC